MRAGAKVGLLGDRGMPVNDNRSQAVCIGTITKTGPVMKGQVPRNLNPRPLMHKWLSMNVGSETAQDPDPPEIERLGRPDTEENPDIFPNQNSYPLTDGPWAVIRRFLFVCFARFHLHFANSSMKRLAILEVPCVSFTRKACREQSPQIPGRDMIPFNTSANTPDASGER